MTAMGDTTFASTALWPTISAPMMDAVWPTGSGRRSPASCSSSNESSIAMTSAATPKGTYCFAAVMESSSFTGSISWWYIETATKAAGRQSERKSAPQRSSVSMEATRKWSDESSGTRMKAASPAGSTKPSGSPSTSTPTRPSSRCMAKASGLSVCSSCGKGERGESTMYSSMSPAVSRPSMSMASSRRSTSSASPSFATPSTCMTATRVPERRPTVVSTRCSSGVRSLRRTSEVFTRSVSTKASLPPLMLFSTEGDEMERVAFERTSKLSAAAAPTETTAQKPASRSVTTSGSSVRRRTVLEYTPPRSSSSSSRRSVRPSARTGSVSGRSMSSAIASPSARPSTQQTYNPAPESSPGSTPRHSKSAKPEKTSRIAAMESRVFSVE